MKSFASGNPVSPEPPSSILAKHDIDDVGAEGFPLYSYKYRDDESGTEYVGVMAQDVLKVRPDAVSTGADGYYRVDYAKLGLRMVTKEEWDRTGSCAAISPEPNDDSNISPESMDTISPEPIESDVRLKHNVLKVGATSPEPKPDGVSPEPKPGDISPEPSDDSTSTVSDIRLKREIRLVGHASPEPVDTGIFPEPIENQVSPEPLES